MATFTRLRCKICLPVISKHFCRTKECISTFLTNYYNSPYTKCEKSITLTYNIHHTTERIFTHFYSTKHSRSVFRKINLLHISKQKWDYQILRTCSSFSGNNIDMNVLEKYVDHLYEEYHSFMEPDSKLSKERNQRLEFLNPIMEERVLLKQKLAEIMEIDKLIAGR